MTPRVAFHASAVLLAAVLGACAVHSDARQATPGPAAVAAAADPALEATAVELHASLNQAQRTQAVLPFDDPQRGEEKFPGGPRAGIALADLDERQRGLALKLIAGFTSARGRRICEQIAAQAGPEGLGRYRLAFFGAPGSDRPYAWRIAEHHLTLVNVEVRSGSLTVGPLLLGANPPDFFGEEEDRLIALYAALTPEDRALVAADGTGVAAEPIIANGAAAWRLSPAAQARLAEVIDHRLSFFAPRIQQRLRAVIEERGGLKALRLAFYGVADRRCFEGGRWDCKIGGPTFLCDYENSRGHLHLSLKGEVLRGRDAR
jgi:hypothetical protein